MLKSYAVWLRNQGIKSVSVFTSGITKVNEEFFMPVRHKDMFEELPGAIMRQEAVDWLTSLESFINLALEKTVVRQETDEFGNGVGPIVKILDITEKKKLENRRNCLRKFIKYVKFLQEASVLPQHDGDDFLTSDKSTVFYSREKLEKTLDIFYNFFSDSVDIFFLPALLKRLFEYYSTPERIEFLKKKNLCWGDNRNLTPIERFNECRFNMLKSTKLYTTNKILRFSEIDGVWINKKGKTVMYVSRGKKYVAINPYDRRPAYHPTKFLLLVEPRIPIGELLKNNSVAFTTFRYLTFVINRLIKGVEIEVEDKKNPKGRKLVKLEELRLEDGEYFLQYVFHALPKKRIWPHLPHFLLELNQIVAFSPHHFAFYTPNPNPN